MWFSIQGGAQLFCDELEAEEEEAVLANEYGSWPRICRPCFGLCLVRSLACGERVGVWVDGVVGDVCEDAVVGLDHVADAQPQ